MSWTRMTEYTPIPTSHEESDSSSSAAPFDSTTVSPPLALHTTSRDRTRRTWRSILYATGGASFLLVVISLLIVPDETLPSRVSTVLGASRDAFDPATETWIWRPTGKTSQDEDASPETGSEENEAIAQTGVEIVDSLREGQGPARNASSSMMEGTVVEDVRCSDEVKKLMNDPTFWTVIKASSDSRGIRTALHYSITSKDSSVIDTPKACLSQAIFSARLIGYSDSATRTPAQETLYALETPEWSPTLGAYDVVIPSELKIPRQRHELSVTLEFGYYPGAIEGKCRGSQQVCHEATVSEEEGEQLAFIGKRIEIPQEENRWLELGTRVPTVASLPLCSDLSELEGYWSSLSYFPLTPEPCSLAEPSFPIPFVPDSIGPRDDKRPVWIHFVGDSNTRNMYSQFLNSLGNGHKISAPKVIDSKTHNGTHASFASRWRSGEIASDDKVPDLIVTWSWWYQSTPLESETPFTEEEAKVAWQNNLEENRDDLLRLVDTNLADYLLYAKLGASTRGNSVLAHLATDLRPHRTYLSLGSHSERLSVPGSSLSLDFLFDETNGLSRSKRDMAHMRVFTTTHVNPTYIPLERFPHQDLVRNNAFIRAKNALTRSRPEFTESPIPAGRGRGGRVINVEALTRGIVVDGDGDWMKPGSKPGRSPDAVHFRREVYQEWVRLVWTDLLAIEFEEERHSSKPLPLPVPRGEVQVVRTINRKQQQWKKSRIEDWDDEEEF